MGRFLTPPKIALLVLAQIYIKGSVPPSGAAKVLDILLSGILFDANPSERVSIHEDDSILSIERALAGQPSVVPGKTVWDIFLKHLWAIDCADGLEWFISEMTQHLGKTREELLKDRDEGIPPEPPGKVVRASPLGMFIRRCSIEYMKIQFQENIAIWIDLVSYRMPTKNAFMRRHPQSIRNAFDSTLADFDVDSTHPLAGIMYRPLLDKAAGYGTITNTYDAEKLLEFQVSEMQSKTAQLILLEGY